jgi:hypothetical protein
VLRRRQARRRLPGADPVQALRPHLLLGSLVPLQEAAARAPARPRLALLMVASPVRLARASAPRMPRSPTRRRWL